MFNLIYNKDNGSISYFNVFFDHFPSKKELMNSCGGHDYFIANMYSLTKEQLVLLTRKENDD